MSIADKLVAIAANEPRVYEAGQQAAHDRFWDAYQQNGKRRRYARAFAGEGWTNVAFMPKYDIVCGTDCRDMFRETALTGDLTQLLQAAGVTLNTRLAGEMQDCFNNASKLTKIGTIDLESCKSNVISLFKGCTALQCIECLKVTEYTTYTNMFQNCTALSDLTIEGTIAKDISLQWCPLSRESIGSVIAALSDTVTGVTLTLNADAVAAAFTTQEWADLVASKPNWTIKTT